MLIKNLYRTFIILSVLVIGALLLPATEAETQTGGLLVARHSKKCLDIKGASTVPRAPAQQFTCHGNANQQWAVAQTSSKGYVSMAVAHSGQCLDVRGNRKSDQAPVQQFTCKSEKSRNQQWLLVPVSNQGYFMVVARHSGKCLDIKAGSTSDQAPAQQYNCTGRKNQQWIFQ